MDIKEQLTKKVGPLPTWGWVALGAGVGVLLYLKKKKSGPATASTTGINNPSAGSDLGTGGYWLGQGQGGSIPSLPPLNNVSTPTGGDIFPPATGTPAGPIAGGTGNVESNTFDYNFAHGLIPTWSGADHQSSLGWYTPGSNQPGVLPVFIDPQSGAAFYYDAAGNLFGAHISGVDAPWIQRANAAVGHLPRPAMLPVGDLYGGIGYQTTEAAAAGGYWGPGGNWVATPTPWNPIAGSPPIGSLAPGTPYTTGSGQGQTQLPPQPSTPGTGGVAVGSGTHYNSVASALSAGYGGAP